MTFKTSKRAIYVAAESTYGLDPSANGSGYLAVPALEIADIADKRAGLETNYVTGRGYKTAPIPGPDGAEFSCSVPVIGMSDAAQDGESPPTADWLDVILTHVFGTVAAKAGSGVVSSSLPTDITLGDDFAAEDLMPLYDALSPTSAPRTHWGVVTSAAGSGVHVLSPMPTALDNQGVALGHRNFRFSDDGGATLSFVYVEDDLQYTLSGGRVTSCKITAEAGQMAKMDLTISFDSRSATSKASLPAASIGPAVTPVKLTVSPVFFNGAEITTKKIDIDFGLAAAEVMATSGTHGRQDHVYGARPTPTLTVEPLRTQAYLDLKHNVTTGRLIVQLGRGYHGASSMPGVGVPVNTLAVAWGGAFAEDVSLADDNGHQRQSIKFVLADQGGTVIPFQLSRA